MLMTFLLQYRMSILFPTADICSLDKEFPAVVDRGWIPIFPVVSDCFCLIPSEPTQPASRDQVKQNVFSSNPILPPHS